MHDTSDGPRGQGSRAHERARQLGTASPLQYVGRCSTAPSRCRRRAAVRRQLPSRPAPRRFEPSLLRARAGRAALHASAARARRPAVRPPRRSDARECAGWSGRSSAASAALVRPSAARNGAAWAGLAARSTAPGSAARSTRTGSSAAKVYYEMHAAPDRRAAARTLGPDAGRRRDHSRSCCPIFTSITCRRDERPPARRRFCIAARCACRRSSR